MNARMDIYNDVLFPNQLLCTFIRNTSQCRGVKGQRYFTSQVVCKGSVKGSRVSGIFLGFLQETLTSHTTIRVKTHISRAYLLEESS